MVVMRVTGEPLLRANGIAVDEKAYEAVEASSWMLEPVAATTTIVVVGVKHVINTVIVCS